jgi:SecD/SecF fusion protein
MQNNSLIRVFGILFALVSIYQLSFTFIASNVENQADIFAEQTISEDVPNYLEVRDQRAIAYLDSIGNNSLYGFTTYNDAKDKELNKGLDLKGGINVILQISIRDILSGLAENTRNPIFNKALDEADILQKSTDDPYIESFFNAFDAVKSGEKLASPDIFANRTLSDEINFDMTDQETQVVVRRKIDESIVSAFEVLRKRIDKFGVTQPNIQRLGTSGRILVELPGAKDVERVQNLLQSTAQLEFWETYKNDELITFLVEANQYLKTTNDKSKAVVEEEKDDASEIDDLLADVSAQDSISASGSNPILDRIVGQGFQGGPVLAQFASRDSELILDYLNQPQVRKLLPSEYRYIQFAWGKPVANSDVVELYALKSNRDNLAPLSGGVVVDALQTFDQVGNAAVSMQMDSRGARIWESMTGKAFKEASNIAIVLDDIVYSAPGVSSGPIAGGRSEITGNFTLNEAIDLANVLRAGKLPASAEIIQSEIVGPSLGQEAIEAGIYSFIIALIFVLGWMIFYYGSSGIYADIALILNILLILAYWQDWERY